jgi:predicted P-loop ATPase
LAQVFNATSRIKQFISSPSDKFRPPFGRATITVLRTSVIVGTTNLASFLHAATGSRRFWVIPIGAVDLTLLREWREQLLAEAVVAFRQGEQHWLTDDEERRRQEFVSQFNETDPWEEPVLRYADQQAEYVRISDVLHDVLNLPLDRQPRREEQRVAAILRRSGWEPAQRRVQGSADHRPLYGRGHVVHSLGLGVTTARQLASPSSASPSSCTRSGAFVTGVRESFKEGDAGAAVRPIAWDRVTSTSRELRDAAKPL